MSEYRQYLSFSVVAECSEEMIIVLVCARQLIGKIIWKKTNTYVSTGP